MDRSAIKKLAKQQIKGNIAMLVLCAVITCVLGNIVPGIAAILLAPVLSFGITLNFMAMNRGEKASLGTFFSAFDRFGEAWCLSFLQGLYIFLWSLLFTIPGIVKAYAYSFAPYILAENPGMSASDAITASKNMTQGHKWELFVLSLSFIGWDILAIFTLGIAYIWILPYQQATFVNAYQAIKQQNAAV